MPHFKCVPCKARLYSPTRPADPVGDCPRCGSPLEPVGELADIVGFQSIEPVDSAAAGEATLARDLFDAGRWLDDGGRFSPEAVAAAVALPAPNKEIQP